jgi:hypothetical protein
MSKVVTFKQYTDLNEALDLSFFKSMKIFSKALLNPFMLSLAPDIAKMMKADPDKQETWIGPYKNIFRKACIKFGGAKKQDIGKTCNKAVTLQKMAELLFDPQKGLIDQKAINDWVNTTTANKDPEKVKYPYDARTVDDLSMKFVDILKKTGVPPAAIKKTGTYLLEMGIPVMLRFYKSSDLSQLKMITSGSLIDAAKAKKLLAGSEEDSSAETGGLVDL